MAASTKDYTYVSAGTYKDKNGKIVKPPNGDLSAYVAKLNKGGTSKDSKDKANSAVTKTDKQTATEFEQKYKDTISAPAPIVDNVGANIVNTLNQGGDPNYTKTPEQTLAVDTLSKLANGGPVDPLETESNNYLANVMRNGMSQEEKDAALAMGSSTINRNLLGSIRAALGASGGQTNGGAVLGQTQANQNAASSQLQDLVRSLILNDMTRKDTAATGLGTQVGNQLQRQSTNIANAGRGIGEIGNVLSQNRVNMFNQMTNGLISQQSFNANLQATNQANLNAFQLGQYGAYMGGIQTSTAATAAKNAQELAKSQLALAQEGIRRGSGSSYQSGRNNTPSFPDPGNSTATGGTNSGGF